MDDQEIVIRDDDGTEHVFPSGFDPQRAIQIVRQQTLTAANQKPLKEPTTQTGGFLKSVGQTVGDTEKGILREVGSMLDPRNLAGLVQNPWSPEGMQAAVDFIPNTVDRVKKIAAGDPGEGGAAIAQLAAGGILGRLMPTGGPKQLPVSHAAAPIREAIRGTGMALADTPNVPGAHGAGLMARLVGNVMQKVPVPKTFQDLPLFRQMESLGPDAATPVTTRFGERFAGGQETPPHPNDVPLFRQQDALPGRLQGPSGPGLSVAPSTQSRQLSDLPLPKPPPGPLMSGRPQAPPPSNFNPNDIPLYRQQESLPTRGPMPQGGRSVAPPRRLGELSPDTPLYLQQDAMERAAAQGAPARPDPQPGTRSSMPPVNPSDDDFIRQMTAGVLEKTKTPGQAPMSEWQSKFLESIDTQLKGGGALSPKQKKQLYKIFQMQNLTKIE